MNTNVNTFNNVNVSVVNTNLNNGTNTTRVTNQSCSPLGPLKK